MVFRKLHRKAFPLVAGAIFCQVLFCVDFSKAQEPPVSLEYQVKAAFLYNLTKFIRWPSVEATASDTTKINICVLGDNPFGDSLTRLRDLDKYASKKVSLHNIDAGDRLAFCHLLFISKSERHRLSEILKAVDQYPVVTVSDIDNFIKQGGIIAFKVRGNKVQLSIERERAMSSGIKISSKLLSIAK